jgi:predicted nucleotidyltransferase
MRISEEEITLIKKLARQIFGNGTKVFLFGSRVDDRKKGGDIDLFITGEQKSNYTVAHKIDFLVELKSLIGDQKIDVILDTESTRQKKQFHRSITRQAVEL